MNLKCSQCSERIRGTDPEKVGFKDRMSKLRRHYKEKHPKKFRESVKKGVETRMGKRTTYKKKSAAKKAAPKGHSVYKVKGGWRVGKKRKKKRK